MRLTRIIGCVEITHDTGAQMTDPRDPRRDRITGTRQRKSQVASDCTVRLLVPVAGLLVSTLNVHVCTRHQSYSVVSRRVSGHVSRTAMRTAPAARPGRLAHAKRKSKPADIIERKRKADPERAT